MKKIEVDTVMVPHRIKYKFCNIWQRFDLHTIIQGIY